MQPQKDPLTPPTETSPSETTPTTDPQPILPPTLEAEPTPKKRKTGLIILISVLAVGLIAAGVYFGISFLSESDKTTPATNESATQVENQVTPTSLIGSIKEELTGSELNDIEASKSLFPFRLDGNKYLTSPEEGSEAAGVSSALATQVAADAEEKNVVNTLESKDFSLNNLSNESVGYVGTSKYWTSDDLVCRVLNTPDTENAKYNVTTQDYDYASFIINVTCANIADYAVTAATIKPFYEAFATKSPAEYADNVVFASVKSEPSATTGYTTAFISQYNYGALVGGYAGLYYQTPDGEWHYFTGTQGGPACSEYNTEDLKKAYLGTTCYDGANQDMKVTL